MGKPSFFERLCGPSRQTTGHEKQDRPNAGTALRPESCLERLRTLKTEHVRSPFIADAAQQARHGPRGRRMGDVRGVFVETRPLPDAADLPCGRQNVPRPEQISNPQGHEPRQLPGGLGQLQGQEGD